MDVYDKTFYTYILHVRTFEVSITNISCVTLHHNTAGSSGIPTTVKGEDKEVLQNKKNVF